MDITPIVPSGRQLVESYGQGGFRVSGVAFDGAVLVFPDRTLSWPVSGFTALGASDFAPVLDRDPRPELLLLGTGARMALLPKPLRQELRQAGIVVEAMDTGAACRTYNILLTEGRRVAAALLPS